VRVTTALVNGGEYPLHSLRGVPDGIEPGPVAAAGLDITRGVALLDFR